MTEVPFGQLADGRMVTVDGVLRGLQCDCMCPVCKSPLVAAKGEIVRHHFRHYSVANCHGAPETALHLFAKQVICDQKQLRRPEYIAKHVGSGVKTIYCNSVVESFSAAEQEKAVGSIRPDVLLTAADEEQIAVEIWVAHKVPDDKIRAYAELELGCIEIDLRHYRQVDKDETAWGNEILYAAPRLWLVPPRSVMARLKQEYEEWNRQMLKLEEERKIAIERERERQRQIIEEVEHVAAIRREAELMREYKRIQASRLVAEQQAQRRQYRDAMLAQLERERFGPSLQELVRVHGGYNRIPPEAWAHYHTEVETFKSKLRADHFRYMERLLP